MPVLSAAEQRLVRPLIEKNLISEELLQWVSNLCNRIPNLKIKDALLGIGIVSEAEIFRVVEDVVGIALVDLEEHGVDEDVLGLVPASVIKEAQCMPFKIEGNQLAVAFLDPLDERKIERVSEAGNMSIKPYATDFANLRWALQTYYDSRPDSPVFLALKTSKDQVGYVQEALEHNTRVLTRVIATKKDLQQDSSFLEKTLEKFMKANAGGLDNVSLTPQVVQPTETTTEVLSAEDVAKQLAQQFQLPYLDDTVQVDPYAVSLVPEFVVRRHLAMPLRIDGDYLIVAMRDPRNVVASDEMSSFSDYDVRIAVASEKTILNLINRFYNREPGESIHYTLPSTLEASSSFARIAQYLILEGHLTNNDFQAVLSDIETEDILLGHVLVAKGLLENDRYTQLRAKAFGVKEATLNRSSLKAYVSHEDALKHVVVGYEEEGVPHLAVSSLASLQSLQSHLPQIKFAVAPKEDISQAIQWLYEEQPGINTRLERQQEQLKKVAKPFLPKVPLGELLVQRGMISQEQLVQLLKEQEQSTVKTQRDSEVYARALALELGCDYVTASTEVHQDALRLIPLALAQRHHIMPLILDDGNLTIAMTDPRQKQALQELEQILVANNHSIKLHSVVASTRSILTLLQYYNRRAVV